jgi:hypothetical protein
LFLPHRRAILHLKSQKRKIKVKNTTCEYICNVLHERPTEKITLFEGILAASRGVGEYDNFGLFLRPSIIALYKKSSLYTINHRFALKALIFCIESLYKKRSKR